MATKQKPTTDNEELDPSLDQAAPEMPGVPDTSTPKEAADMLTRVRVLKHGFRIGGLIMAKGAIAKMPLTKATAYAATGNVEIIGD